ncbi:MAG: hypothetical protein ACRD03_02830 [Acidimicrobiales bacterium]
MTGPAILSTCLTVALLASVGLNVWLWGLAFTPQVPEPEVSHGTEPSGMTGGGAAPLSLPSARPAWLKEPYQNDWPEGYHRVPLQARPAAVDTAELTPVLVSGEFADVPELEPWAVPA